MWQLTNNLTALLCREHQTPTPWACSLYPLHFTRQLEERQSSISLISVCVCMLVYSKKPNLITTHSLVPPGVLLYQECNAEREGEAERGGEISNIDLMWRLSLCSLPWIANLFSHGSEGRKATRAAGLTTANRQIVFNVSWSDSSRERPMWNYISQLLLAE